MARVASRDVRRFTVPETWRRIQKLNEPQGTGLFDVLVCGHAVPASDTAYRRFRSCPDCRLRVQDYADEVAGHSHVA
jgi:hypothetical protein